MPAELRSPKKGLINIKNADQKCFLWCQVRHINPVKIHPERITKEDKKLVRQITNSEKIIQENVNGLDYDETELPVQEKYFSKIEINISICINVFGYENGLTFPIYVSNQKFEDSMGMLLLIDDDKSHVYIKILTDLCFTKQKIKTNTSAKVVCSVLVVKMF